MRRLASGYDATGYCAIEASDLVGAESVIVKVGVTIGGMQDESAYALVRIAEAPACEVTAPATVTAGPATVTVKTSAENRAVVSVVSRGIAYSTPSGTAYQRSGDVVFAGTVDIEDIEVGTDGLYLGTVALEGADLIDGCSYEVRAYVDDPATGLRSDVATGEFAVAWAHQAGYPTATVTVDSSAMTASVKPVAPTGAATTDVADVYRVTPHGADLIASRSLRLNRHRPLRAVRIEARGHADLLQGRVPHQGRETWPFADFRLLAQGTRAQAGLGRWEHVGAALQHTGVRGRGKAVRGHHDARRARASARGPRVWSAVARSRPTS